MRRVALLLLPLLALLACASNEKRGDQAAAVGDWKSAERQYAAALQSDPQNPDKRAKWQQARAQALQGAVAAAQACRVSQDWECAFAESDYAAHLEPGSADYAALRAEASRNVAFVRLRQASDATARRDHRAAFDLLARGRDVSSDPGVQTEAARVSQVAVAAAVRDAEGYRAAQQFPQAIELLTLAAGADGSVRPRLDAVRAEQARWIDAQYEVAAREGDALLRDRRFADAAARYEAAEQLKKNGRAEPLLRYARACASGDQAVQRRDWAAATAAYDAAVRTGQDAGGFAATELARVQVRPYALRVRSVLVKPVRPDGAPWAGNRSRGFDRAVGLLVSAALDGRGGAAVQLYDALPHENRPNLVATVTLPDGRQFATTPVKALRTQLEASVAFATNAYDDRPVTIRISHAEPQGAVDVGAVTFRFADALAGELALSDRSIMDLRIVAEPSPLRDGQAQGFAPVPPPGAPAAAPPPPAQTTPATPASYPPPAPGSYPPPRR